MLCPSRTASYALRVLAHLSRQPDGWVSGPDRVSRATGVPRASTVKVLHRLGRLGLVRAKPGCRGGYRLDCDPARTSALDVVRAIDGSDALDRCLLGYGRCSDRPGCRLQPLGSAGRAHFERGLGAITLLRIGEAIEQERSRKEPNRHGATARAEEGKP